MGDAVRHGGQVTRHVSDRLLTRGFTTLLVVVAGYVVVRAGTSLQG